MAKLAPDRSTVAYISAPYSATEENPSVEHNIQRAWQVAYKYWQMGYTVLCPHTNSYHMDASASYAEVLKGYLELLRRCDVVVMLPKWTKSKGAREEHALALKLKMPIIYERRGT